jgi:hypothetical protein
MLDDHHHKLLESEQGATLCTESGSLPFFFKKTFHLEREILVNNSTPTQNASAFLFKHNFIASCEEERGEQIDSRVFLFVAPSTWLQGDGF